jgi:hypothetical protein
MNAIKYIFLLLLTLIFWQCQAQYRTRNYYSYLYEQGNISLGVGPVVLVDTKAGSPYAGAFSMQYFLGSRYCVKTDLVIGNNYVHMGPGLLGIPFWLIFNYSKPSENYFYNLSDLREMAFEVMSFIIFTTLSFEQMSYHIPLSKNSDVAPTISLLRLTFQPSDTNKLTYDSGTHLGGVIGCRYNHYLGRFVFSPYAEYAMFYDNNRYSFNLGITASYLFQPRRGRFL